LKKIVDIATKLATLRIIAIGIWKTPITNWRKRRKFWFKKCPLNQVGGLEANRVNRETEVGRKNKSHNLLMFHL
jgi:hypothetical protein